MRKILFFTLLSQYVLAQLDPNITSNPLSLADRKFIKPSTSHKCDNLSLEDLFKYKDAPPPLQEIFLSDWWGGRVGNKRSLHLQDNGINQRTMLDKEIDYPLNSLSAFDNDLFFKSLQDKFCACYIDIPQDIQSKNFNKYYYGTFFSKDEVFLEISYERYKELLKYFYEKYKYIKEVPYGYIFENNKLHIRTFWNARYCMISIKKL